MLCWLQHNQLSAVGGTLHTPTLHTPTLHLVCLVQRTKRRQPTRTTHTQINHSAATSKAAWVGAYQTHANCGGN